MTDERRHQHAIPADQFERVLEEMRRFSNLIEQQERNIVTSRGIGAIEARRCFALSSTRLQEAGFWFQEALKHARSADVEPKRDKSSK